MKKLIMKSPAEWTSNNFEEVVTLRIESVREEQFRWRCAAVLFLYCNSLFIHTLMIFCPFVKRFFELQEGDHINEASALISALMEPCWYTVQLYSE